ncbi:carbohydrate ABC transporter permease [Tessaracoccus sp. ZS01]|uniref:carbohydrate ABC transporter permease n=1 Tax=Tessaracoccus sp. ZS01 TaxID=1906324 RepID=UPI00096DE362|nr:carbohydrate ABC transporter permease [Tessaracoccus sp. ZS01]MCG6568260.1 carbohydrate ABC transporter permease [Tessaracoccus sp. ZS01]OMG53354.1 sugar ABC transporter permease [Tessaracoccus sp. ZS01]
MSRTRSRNRRRAGQRWAGLGLGLIALIWALPVYWMVNSSFMDRSDLLSTPPNLLPPNPTLENYSGVLSDPSFWSALRMSLFTALITVTFTTAASLLAALALSRFGFRGRRSLIVAILVIQMIPAEALFLSQYRMLDGWSLLNSVSGLSLLYIGGVLPFVIWMMRGFIDGVPQELEQAAMVDGCSRIGAFMRITLPLLLPGLISTGVFAFLHAWNEYTLALIVLSRDTAVTLPIWLQSFQQGLRGSDWGGVMAGSTLIAVPVMILFAVVQNRMGQGLVSGAVKG